MLRYRDPNVFALQFNDKNNLKRAEEAQAHHGVFRIETLKSYSDKSSTSILS